MACANQRKTWTILNLIKLVSDVYVKSCPQRPFTGEKKSHESYCVMQLMVHIFNIVNWSLSHSGRFWLTFGFAFSELCDWFEMLMWHSTGYWDHWPLRANIIFFSQSLNGQHQSCNGFPPFLALTIKSSVCYARRAVIGSFRFRSARNARCV